MSAIFWLVRFVYMPIPPALPVIAFCMLAGLFAPFKTFRVAGTAPWQAPQLLLAYSALPLLADVTAAGLVTVTVRVTVAAAAKVPLPAWSAVMVQSPAASIVRVLPATEHTDGVVEANVTVRLESALADKVAGVPTFCAPGDVKVMVCLVSIAPDAAATLKE